MVKNSKGGNKARKGKNHNSNLNSRPLVYKKNSPDSDQLYARCISRLGYNRVQVFCENGTEKNCRIPGKFMNRKYINVGDTLIIIYDKSKSDDMGEVNHIYTAKEVDNLKTEGKINDNMFMKPEEIMNNQNFEFEVESKNKTDFYSLQNDRIKTRTIKDEDLEFLDGESDDSDSEDSVDIDNI
jgi:initiation factor 1A